MSLSTLTLDLVTLIPISLLTVSKYYLFVSLLDYLTLELLLVFVLRRTLIKLDPDR